MAPFPQINAPASKLDVWFQLVDMNGQPYKGTSADKISFAFSADVAGFRKVVKAEYDQPKYLKDIPAGVLLVFKNKAAFDAKEAPLDLRKSLDGLVSEEDTLLVLVPDSSEPSAATDSRKKALLISNAEAPSSLAEPQVFFSSPSNISYHLHRPKSQLNDLPIALLHPVFGQFIDHLDTVALDNNDCAYALQFMGLMSEYYLKESIRQHALHQVLSSYLNYENLQYPIGDNNRKMDGCVKSNELFVLILEIKNELCGTNICPYLQHMVYYGQSLGNYRAELHERTRFPAFGVYVSGSFIGVTGLIYCNGKVHCQPLTDFVPCLHVPHARSHWEKVARLLKSLKIGMSTLLRQAATTEDTSVHAVDVAAENVYPHLRNIAGSPVEYLEKISDRKNLYIVEWQGQKLLMKFTRSYSIDVHKFFAARDAAPKLYAFRSLPGGWIFILMEYHQQAKQLRNVSGISNEDREAIGNIMTNHLNALHQYGFVHGDFRPNNVLIERLEQGSVPFKISIVDFDHSGKINEACYPSFLNTADIRWAPGVACCTPMLPEHDLHFVDLFVRNVSAEKY